MERFNERRLARRSIAVTRGLDVNEHSQLTGHQYNARKSHVIVVACALMSAALGTIHAFSIFIPEWETSLSADRGTVGFIYSASLVSLTVAVLFGFKLFRLVKPPLLVLLAGVFAAVGLFICTQADSVLVLYLAYGVVFGFANGVGYGFILQLSGFALPKRRGVAMGSVTACYALGASVSPPVLSAFIAKGGNALALTALGVLLAGVFAAVGLFICTQADSVLVLYLAYGVVFGFANGLGYGFILQLSGFALPMRRGVAMGSVTACYALGASVSPPVLSVFIAKGGNALALTALGVLLLLISVVVAVALYWGRAVFESEARVSAFELPAGKRRMRMSLWLGYGCAVFAGLMIIGHVYPIALALKLTMASATLATSIVAIGNLIGGFSVALLADRFSGFMLLKRLPLLTAFGLLILLSPLNTSLPMVLLGFACIGFSYGAIIALVPLVVVDWFGALQATRIYGQVFTAWGLAGLLGPWLGGVLYEQSQAYSMSLLLAVMLSAVSLWVFTRSEV